ncbi:GDP-4-keto-6-deoxy-D-mannose-3-dehydratase / pyridoxamine-phosphate transaminase [Chryseobacterium aquaeductus]|uniref:GDP-4-keto-6-deoxy-D-mannose-3-dehydratase / pyridoxamine-phosphate transaminase n=1 Tax=Chryseobacterium aquaeductus TaxID=2675056 RepID=A0A9N8MET3_9FLAO|nr:DegT/DnrJ/EryC1/StrS aminotransferase family protein [Chryseobacterium aquaeductus]CAA7330481.1 GDP-4-keto-6-deoxy-D-mannose-3-dehydratase / pyridoxamine-phosphate transaminase [Chryseobacterium potabilaquae]CAD7803937.1 GDP-4-keto-6-deoxy-D-mannose-3-dehydratase / pyridoxamine-phosphate transaminase [Chryseobacterium aquaeductus]
MRKAFLNEAETKKALAQFILQADRLSMDVECGKFEKKFAKYQQCKHAVLFNSGGSANLAMLQALKNMGKLKDGDKIGFSALTWSTNTMPIIQMNMIPVVIDVTPEVINTTSQNLLERLETTDLQALFITNILGFTGDIDTIRKICEERNIILIEDNCESLGTELPEGRTGNFGIGASFSFFVAHHMSTIEGGMVCTSDDDFAEMLRIVRANGWDRNLSPEQQQKWRTQFGIQSEFEAKYTFYDLGYNFRPTEITGFLGQYQMQFLEKNISSREHNYLRIEKIVKENPDFLTLKHDHINVLSTFAFPFVCKTAELRSHYLQKFIDAGVEIRPMIAGNMQSQPFYQKYVSEIYDMPGADMMHNNGFYCGNYPELLEEDLVVFENLLRK